MQQHLSTCDPNSSIHSAKVRRLGEKHIEKAKSYAAKAKAEVRKRKQDDNDCKIKGIKHISKAIGEQQGKPLTCVYRDRDTSGGGRKGEMTSNPVEVDAIVKRAWQAIYEGVGGCIATAIDKFLETYSSLIIKLPEAYLPPLDAEAVQEAFSRIKESAGALDGWSPKELSLLSREMYGHLAIMLTQVEAGAPWPRSSRIPWKYKSSNR